MKKFFATLLVASLMFVVSGCSSDEPAVSAPTSPEENTPRVASTPDVQIPAAENASDVEKRIFLRQIENKEFTERMRRENNVAEDVILLPIEIQGYDLESMTHEEILEATVLPDIALAFGYSTPDDGLENDVLVILLPGDAPASNYLLRFTPKGEEGVTATFTLTQ